MMGCLPAPWRTLALSCGVLPHLRYAITYNYSRREKWRQRLRRTRRLAIGMATPDSSPKKESAAPRCRICDKPVALETAETDDAGNAIHAECYALTLKLEQASTRHAQIHPWKVVAAEVSSNETKGSSQNSSQNSIKLWTNRT